MTIRDLFSISDIPIQRVAFVAVVSSAGVVINPENEQEVWFGESTLSDKFLDSIVLSHIVSSASNLFESVSAVLGDKRPDYLAADATLESILALNGNGDSILYRISPSDNILFVFLPK